MRKLLIFSTIWLLGAVACTTNNDAERSDIYIISTNDIHANINLMPQLATLVAEYDRLGDVLLIDSGDRITGNAFVDDAPQPGMPMVELMNSIGYDVVTLGNHEFDNGSEALNAMAHAANFEIVCANVTTPETFYRIEPYTIIEVADVELGIAGVVDTDNGGRPLGGEEALSPFNFSTDIETAYETSTTLSSKCDFCILLSHMGLEQDLRLAERKAHYDWIAGGHSHDVVGRKHGDSYISQNGKNLRSVTVAHIEVCDGEIERVSYLREAIDEREPDIHTAEMVAEIKRRNPELNNVEGRATASATQDGVANFMIAALANYPYADGFSPEVSIYHFGGVRLTNILAGDITRGDIYNNDPFRSTIYIGEMTPEQMRTFILDKYNSGSTEQPDKESHYPYFRSNIPYTIVLDDAAELPDAIDVVMELEEGRSYRVAMCNYIAENYIDKEIVARQLRPTGYLVREAMLHYLHSLTEGLTPDNHCYQSEVRASQLNE